MKLQTDNDEAEPCLLRRGGCQATTIVGREELVTGAEKRPGDRRP